MMWLLLNNIGNRHLRKDGEFLDKKKFREKTKIILDNWDTEKEHITLEILSQYLNEKSLDKPVKVVLFATDQNDSRYNSQDTVYAAGIIKKILNENYGIENVEIKIISHNPSDENVLLPEYKKFLNGINFRDRDKHWSFLDAGGTPQQKLVCKLLIPEIHPDYKIDYIKNVEGSQSTELVNKEYDKIENFYILKNVKNLIKLGHYNSAHDLLNKENKAYTLVKLGTYRLNNNYKNFKTFNKKELQYEPVKNFYHQIPNIDLNELKDSIGKYPYFLYGEFISRADLYLSKKNYNAFILTFNQSLEFLANRFLYDMAISMGADLKNGFNDYEKVSSFLKIRGVSTEFSGSIPARIKESLKISKEQNLETVNNLFSYYAQINAGYQINYLKQKNVIGLDTLRNRLVHNGKNLDYDDVKEIIQYFDKIKKLLHHTRNGYTELNNLIQERLFL